MSLIITAERFGSPSKTIQIRTPFAHVGEENSGVLTCHTPLRSYFSIYAVDNRFYCSVDHPQFHLYKNGERRSRAWIEEGDVLRGEDYTFTFYQTNSLSEVLSRSLAPAECVLERMAQEPPQLQLIYQLAGCSRSFPLLLKFPVSIGSASDCMIYIPSARIAGLHCIVYAHSVEHVRIDPVDGIVSLDRQKLSGPCSLSAVQEVALQLDDLNLIIKSAANALGEGP